jgi:hypothetical protein
VVPLVLAGWIAWTLGVGAGLLLLLAVVQVWGRFLPVVWTAEEEALLPVPPEEAWRRATDVEKRPFCVSSCKRVERLPDESGLSVHREHLGPTSITVRTLEARPPRRLVREGADDVVVPLTMRSELNFEPADGGTRVRLRSRVEVRDGTWQVPFFRVALKLGGGARGPVRKYLASLARD